MANAFASAWTMKKTPHPLVAIRCDPALLDQIKTYADDERINFSSAVRQLIIEGMRRKGIEVPKQQLARTALVGVEE